MLWDVDRTLLYVGQIDRQVYREVFAELVGEQPRVLPAKGAGRTVPLAVWEMFLVNGIDETQAGVLTARALELIPGRFASYRSRLAREGIVLPGAIAALSAVRSLPGTVATVVTGNLRSNAVVKLEAVGLAGFVDLDVGGYASDDPHRPALVAIASAARREARRQLCAALCRASLTRNRPISRRPALAGSVRSTPGRRLPGRQ